MSTPADEALRLHTMKPVRRADESDEDFDLRKREISSLLSQATFDPLPEARQACMQRARELLGA